MFKDAAFLAIPARCLRLYTMSKRLGRRRLHLCFAQPTPKDEEIVPPEYLQIAKVLTYLGSRCHDTSCGAFSKGEEG